MALRLRGFTLIELMIVVAIIAIIAAIAIPNLLRSRMSANEAAAIAGVKACCEAQEIYRRTDYDSDGVLEYSFRMHDDLSLYETAAGLGDIALISSAIAHAERQSTVGSHMDAVPYAGYLYRIQRDYENPSGQTVNWYVGGNFTTGNLTLGYAFYAAPASYDGTGRNSFTCSNQGVVYQKDLESWNWGSLNVHSVDSTWVVAE